MGDEGEIWNKVREHRKKSKWEYCDKALMLLHEKGIVAKPLEPTLGHYRVGEYDFWATTGTFMHRKTKNRGQGVDNLIKAIKNNQ